MKNFQATRIYLIGCIFMLSLMSCERLVDIDEPIDSITTEKIFKSETHTESALLGIYSTLIHGIDPETIRYLQASASFASGGMTLAGALASDEQLVSLNDIAESRLTSSIKIWETAFKVVYLSNSIIENIDRFSGGFVRDSLKKQFTAEARVLRAFAYLQLVSLYGDLPLVTTTDIQSTSKLARNPKEDIMNQIINDLEFGYETLPVNFDIGGGERIRVQKWVAASLLARTHLYNEDYEKAEHYANEVISQTSLFALGELSQTFKANSSEAIFQLKPTNQNIIGNATPEGYELIPSFRHTGIANYAISKELLSSFEDGDLRKVVWIDSTDQSRGNDPQLKTAWYPSKYKISSDKTDAPSVQTEYYTVIRLAELYLIRAEARSKKDAVDLSGAISDLNVLRKRAKLNNLANSLSSDQLFNAIMRERQLELFFEWGHRWIDLVRTGIAKTELSKSPKYQPWPGDWCLLFPIPPQEIRNNPRLIQNPGYDVYLSTNL